jgi:hypothetical protein
MYSLQLAIVDGILYIDLASWKTQMHIYLNGLFSYLYEFTLYDFASVTYLYNFN